MKKGWVIFILLISFIFIYIILILAVVPRVIVVEESNATLGAHRGDWGLFEENTLEGLKSAVEKDKFKFIEFDVQYTRDKVMILHHDKSLVRTQKKNYQIPDLNYSELLNISNYHIPTYVEAMEIVSGKKPLNLEIKSQGNFEDDKKLIDFLIADLEKRKIRNTTVLSSISKEILIYVRDNYNNKSLSADSELGISSVENYFEEKPYIETGIVYYVDSSTFLPIEKIFISNLVGTANELKVNYLLLHGSNIHNYPEISRRMPNGMRVIFWYFDNRMYIINREKTSRVEISLVEGISKTEISNIKFEDSEEVVIVEDKIDEGKLVITKKESIFQALSK